MGKRTVLYSVIFVMLLGVIAVGLYRHRRMTEYRSDEFLMDTLVSIRVYGRNPDNLRTAVAEAFAEMRGIAEVSDRFPKKGTPACGVSDVCRINAQAGGQPVSIGKDVYAMLDMAKKYHEMTGGAFDVTIGPVMDLWGFGSNAPHVPGSSEIATALAFVDSGKVLLNANKNSARLESAGMSLDLGALAKGYATEKAAMVLKKHGIGNALIDAGGNIRVIGKNPRGGPWRIGIKNPRKSGEILAVIPLEDAAAVTSGDYYRYFESGGKRYHHILSPGTGCPASENRSVTVIAGDAAQADVLSTSLFVMEPGKALETGKRLGVEVFLVSADGRILYTPGLRDRIELEGFGEQGHEQGR